MNLLLYIRYKPYMKMFSEKIWNSDYSEISRSENKILELGKRCSLNFPKCFVGNIGVLVLGEILGIRRIRKETSDMTRHFYFH